MTRYNRITETVGRTPVVKINRLGPKNVNLWVKVEAFNPLGSVKDRLALGIIEAAEKSGELKPGQTVIEATSGNTGIGLAMVCAERGYPFVSVMAESFSVERRRLMRFLGAKVVLTPAPLRALGMVDKVRELVEKHGWFWARQFENPANPDFHERTTGREIVDDFKDIKLDYWVTGYGTGGTLTGVTRVLDRESPATKVVVCEPETAALLSSGEPQQRNADGTPSKTHPAWQPHPIQGWTPDFIPEVTQESLDRKAIDQVVKISGPEAMTCARDLATHEGIFVGISSGATFAAGLRVAAEAPDGANILIMLPDTGERYLSTPLFEHVPAEMTDEEKAIFESTPLGIPATA
ncbi:MAG TPA: cysteine synthase A [Caulobacteraceae bacterium]|jgi:cysteine synthase A|nr:cysteine synthase A [Caulobacteraceae bacterium]